MVFGGVRGMEVARIDGGVADAREISAVLHQRTPISMVWGFVFVFRKTS